MVLEDGARSPSTDERKEERAAVPIRRAVKRSGDLTLSPGWKKPPPGPRCSKGTIRPPSEHANKEPAKGQEETPIQRPAKETVKSVGDDTA